jgi:hypothetical protein
MLMTLGALWLRFLLLDALRTSAARLPGLISPGAEFGDVVGAGTHRIVLS